MKQTSDRPGPAQEKPASKDPPAAAVQPSNQPTQVDPREAKLSREDIAKKIPPPGLMGDVAGPSA